MQKRYSCNPNTDGVGEHKRRVSVWQDSEESTASARTSLRTQLDCVPQLLLQSGVTRISKFLPTEHKQV